MSNSELKNQLTKITYTVNLYNYLHSQFIQLLTQSIYTITYTFYLYNYLHIQFIQLLTHSIYTSNISLFLLFFIKEPLRLKQQRKNTPY